ncbi:signal peptidase I [Gluconacetobacter takamatsuzukensis]|uniref:Signal peptidase I n=1 Tax=Gluconacetobacter takamatsuzukensis TaxID=1286190 RepID=A0A7W4KCZ9_9PROT|nr:signal peptidase I [Gluconacetobacter takamatsuzukensis]MBB2204678.1 signal peptidase I [Gluconacetobacter takamatsuzukensis]
MDDPHKTHTTPLPSGGILPALRGAWDLVRTIVVALTLAIGVRTILFEPFNIPSGSMIPTLQVGDYLWVAKYSYGYSHFSLPFSPELFSGRVLERTPHRGDVAVFRFTKDTSIDYIKRIVGLPGDRVQVRGGELYLNDVLVPRVTEGDYVAVDEHRTRMEGQRFRETLPGSAGAPPVEHDILKLTNEGFQNDTPVYVVPPGYFFAMGDNRDDSADSRFMGDDPQDLGFVPMENLIGQAKWIFLSLDTRYPVWAFWMWPAEIRWNRLFMGVQ